MTARCPSEKGCNWRVCFSCVRWFSRSLHSPVSAAAGGSQRFSAYGSWALGTTQVPAQVSRSQLVCFSAVVARRELYGTKMLRSHRAPRVRYVGLGATELNMCFVLCDALACGNGDDLGTVRFSRQSAGSLYVDVC